MNQSQILLILAAALTGTPVFSAGPGEPNAKGFGAVVQTLQQIPAGKSRGQTIAGAASGMNGCDGLAANDRIRFAASARDNDCPSDPQADEEIDPADFAPDWAGKVFFLQQKL